MTRENLKNLKIFSGKDLKNQILGKEDNLISRVTIIIKCPVFNKKLQAIQKTGKHGPFQEKKKSRKCPKKDMMMSLQHRL